MTKLLFRAVLGLFLVMVVASISLGGFIWYRLGILKTEVTKSLEKDLQADVSIETLSLDPWNQELLAKNITVVNSTPTSQHWKRAEIGEAVASFNYGDFFRREIPLAIHVSDWKLELELDETGATTSPATTPGPGGGNSGSDSPSAASTDHSSVRITEVTAEKGKLEIQVSEDHTAFFDGVHLKGEEDSTHQWTSHFVAETFNMDSIKATDVSSTLVFQPDGILMTDIRADCKPGEVTGQARVVFGAQEGIETELDLKDVQLEPLLDPSWQGKVAGKVTGHFKMAAAQGRFVAQGKVQFKEGIFNLFPALSILCKTMGTSDFGSLALDHAETKFLFQDDVLSLTDMDLRKDGVARIIGQLQVTNRDALEGHLELGLPDAYTSKVPNLEAQIFTTEMEDYHWTDVHLTGTAEHPVEDLSPRLVQFGTQQGGNFLQSVGQKALNWWFGK
jgi:hypothetical protein